jgi:hypothetical protein
MGTGDAAAPARERDLLTLLHPVPAAHGRSREVGVRAAPIVAVVDDDHQTVAFEATPHVEHPTLLGGEDGRTRPCGQIDAFVNALLGAPTEIVDHDRHLGGPAEVDERGLRIGDFAWLRASQIPRGGGAASQPEGQEEAGRLDEAQATAPFARLPPLRFEVAFFAVAFLDVALFEAPAPKAALVTRTCGPGIHLARVSM